MGSNETMSEKQNYSFVCGCYKSCFHYYFCVMCQWHRRLWETSYKATYSEFSFYSDMQGSATVSQTLTHSCIHSYPYLLIYHLDADQHYCEDSPQDS